MLSFRHFMKINVNISTCTRFNLHIIMPYIIYLVFQFWSILYLKMEKCSFDKIISWLLHAVLSEAKSKNGIKIYICFSVLDLNYLVLKLYLHGIQFLCMVCYRTDDIQLISIQCLHSKDHTCIWKFKVYIWSMMMANLLTTDPP